MIGLVKFSCRLKIFPSIVIELFLNICKYACLRFSVKALRPKQYSDGRTCHKTWIAKGINPFHEMQSVLGVDPPREWAQIRAEGDRAGVSRVGDREKHPGRGAMPRGWRNAEAPAHPPPRPPAGQAAGKPAGAAKPGKPAGAAKPSRQKAGARRGCAAAASTSAPKPRQRRFAIAAVPDAAAAAEKACRSGAGAQGHPVAAHAASVAAPSGPGPPPSGGPQNPIAAARPPPPRTLSGANGTA